MPSEPPTLSLIIITRNRREELNKTLVSIKQQDADFELVIVDNGSTDGTADMVRVAYGGAVIIELAENEGVSGGRNRGLEAARGDLLVFLDDDATFAAPDALSRMRRRFMDGPELGILATNSYLTETGEPERAAIPRRDKRIFVTDYESSYFCGVGFAVRREVFEKVGSFFVPYIYGCEELDFSWRAVDKGYRIVWAADIVVLHRRSMLERPQGRWIYSNAKNRVWLAARHLPWRYVVSHGVIWWSYLLWIAARNGLLGDYFKGVRDSLRGLPVILNQRKRLSDAAISVIREKNGRLIC
ncbi:MAG: glycosyltransferase family 2 protein [Steroidobacteraceae bacterium]